MTIGETLDRIGAVLSTRWHEFTLVFVEPISEWPLWTGVLVIGVMLLWSLGSIRTAQNELSSPTKEQLNYKSRFESPLFMAAASIICAGLALSILISGWLPGLVKGTCLEMGSGGE